MLYAFTPLPLRLEGLLNLPWRESNLLNQTFYFRKGLWDRGQVLISIFGNVNVILDAHSTHGPVPL